jgi:hypothetical protein
VWRTVGLSDRRAPPLDQIGDVSVSWRSAPRRLGPARHRRQVGHSTSVPLRRIVGQVGNGSAANVRVDAHPERAVERATDRERP